ncbi:MAG: SDR family NAD(P)-dependent oxidoreductase [Nitrososphaerota archaeon]
MMGRLDNRVSIITGASRGIGRAIALEMAKEGARIVGNATSMSSLAGLEKELGELGADYVMIPADLSSADGCLKLIRAAAESMGRIDVLVNNAGINIVRNLEAITLEEWESVINVNLRAPFLCSKYASELMKSQRYGRIINLASIASFVSMPGRSAYNSSKAGILGLTRTLAIELAPYGITVNAIAPGLIETEMLRQRIAEGSLNLETSLRRIPLGRLGRPGEVAKVAVFLASEDSSYITGQVIVVDGGFLALAMPL